MKTNQERPDKATDETLRLAKMQIVDRPVPVSLWGKDHWSTFAFVAHWCAEFGADGFDIQRKRQLMRCDPSSHPAFAHVAWSDDVPTLLAGMAKLPMHDDWDCLYDTESAGLVELKGTGTRPLVKMTDAGLVVAAKLTEHKTRGGSFADFSPG